MCDASFRSTPLGFDVKNVNSCTGAWSVASDVPHLFREVLPVITMDSWNDPVIQRAAELCYLINDHQFTPFLGLHACINGNDDFLIRESSIKIVECITVKFKREQRDYRIWVRQNQLARYLWSTFEARSYQMWRFLLNGGKPVSNTWHNANGLYKFIQRYIEKKEAEAATIAVIDDDTSLLWLPPTNASPASSTAHSSMSSLTAPSFEYGSPSNLTASFEHKLHCCLGTVWLGTLSNIEAELARDCLLTTTDKQELLRSTWLTYENQNKHCECWEQQLVDLGFGHYASNNKEI